jgi:hypothetical protein
MQKDNSPILSIYINEIMLIMEIVPQTSWTEAQSFLLSDSYRETPFMFLKYLTVSSVLRKTKGVFEIKLK